MAYGSHGSPQNELFSSASESRYQTLNVLAVDCPKELCRRMAVRDRDVREALHRKVLKEHHGDANTLVLDELGLHSDTLSRLPGQIAVYGAVLDRATLVVGEKYLSNAKAFVPDWWGIKIATVGARGAILFKTEQSLGLNPSIDPLALAELLWRPEAIEVLRLRGCPAAVLRKPRKYLYSYLAESVALNELRDIVRLQLKARSNWRGHRPPSSDADSLTPTPM
jgi:hypothetical protein